MTATKTVLILHFGPETSVSGLQRLTDAVGGADAKVMVHACDEQFGEILDAVERADTIVLWR